MTTVGVVSPGFMGAGLGWALRLGGARVVATVAGRSERTGRLAREAGLDLLPSLDDVVGAADVVLSVVPPGEVRATARAIAAAATRTGRRPILADLNAVAPATMAEVAGELATMADAAGSPATMADTAGSPATMAEAPATMADTAGEPAGALLLVDGAISGPPPTARPGARLYLSGPDAAAVAALPWAGKVEPIVLGAGIGTASAVKMSTASVYKGLTALVIQAMRSAGRHGVLDVVLADLAGNGLDHSAGVASAATKAHRFVAEMREIAATQAEAGLTPALFEAVAAVYADVAATALAEGDPESAGVLSPAEMVRRLSS